MVNKNKVLHETCPQYVTRRLSEGWKIIGQKGFNLILQSPGGILRPINLRNDVETLRPNAAGDETSISRASPAVVHYLNVNEEEADDLDTYVWTDITSYERDLYKLPASSGNGPINFIKIYFRCCGIGGDGNAKPSLKSNSAVEDGTEVAVSVYPSWTTHSQQWNANPADSEDWEWADIDTLQIGVSLQKVTGNVCCTQVYVEVDYAPTVVHEKTFTETIKITDSIVKSPTKLLAESVVVTDSIVKKLYHRVAKYVKFNRGFN